jgi:hypothetical protein
MFRLLEFDLPSPLCLCRSTWSVLLSPKNEAMKFASLLILRSLKSTFFKFVFQVTKNCNIVLVETTCSNTDRFVCLSRPQRRLEGTRARPPRSSLHQPTATSLPSPSPCGCHAKPVWQTAAARFPAVAFSQVHEAILLGSPWWCTGADVYISL